MNAQNGTPTWAACNLLGGADAFTMTYTPSVAGAQAICFFNAFPLNEVGIIESYIYTDTNTGYQTVRQATDVYVQSNGVDIYIACVPSQEDIDSSVIYHIRIHRRSF